MLEVCRSRAFESTARHVSFKDAARELGVTQIGQNDVQNVATAVVEPIGGGVSGLDALQPGAVGARPQRLHQSVMIGPLSPRIGSVSGSAVPAMLALVA